MYSCENCKTSFTLKDSLETSAKVGCKEGEGKSENPQKVKRKRIKRECFGCGKILANRYNLSRHTKTCKNFKPRVDKFLRELKEVDDALTEQERIKDELRKRHIDNQNLYLKRMQICGKMLKVFEEHKDMLDLYDRL